MNCGLFSRLTRSCGTNNRLSSLLWCLNVAIYRKNFSWLLQNKRGCFCFLLKIWKSSKSTPLSWNDFPVYSQSFASASDLILGVAEMCIYSDSTILLLIIVTSHSVSKLSLNSPLINVIKKNLQIRFIVHMCNFSEQHTHTHTHSYRLGL